MQDMGTDGVIAADPWKAGGLRCGSARLEIPAPAAHRAIFAMR
jgi:hypothetical protein